MRTSEVPTKEIQDKKAKAKENRSGTVGHREKDGECNRDK